MANWVEIYRRAEDLHLEMLQKRAERRKARKEQQSQQTSSQATTGTTTRSKKENPRGESRHLKSVLRLRTRSDSPRIATHPRTWNDKNGKRPITGRLPFSYFRSLRKSVVYSHDRSSQISTGGTFRGLIRRAISTFLSTFGSWPREKGGLSSCSDLPNRGCFLT